ncbi:MAG: SCO family protein [Candidatus Rokubacteria bacterium]|nr:SCO family protein [Candidatus Rokubacteria bacterium]
MLPLRVATLLAVAALLSAGGSRGAEAPSVLEVRQVPVAGYLPVIRDAPPFALDRADGRRVRLADLRGKVVVLAFIYTSCTDTCPLISGKLATLQRRLQDKKLLRDRVVILSITFDPGRDRPEVLQRYAKGFRADPEGWLFLRATEAETQRLLREFDVWVRPAPDGEFDHADRIFLIDQAGRIREIYNQRLLAVKWVLRDVLSLLSAP